jgi:hypothetical protein
MQQARARFEREARTAARLRHPNVIEITELVLFQVDGPNRADAVKRILQ